MLSMENIPEEESQVDEEERLRAFELEQAGARHREGVIQKFKRIDQNTLSEYGIGPKAGLDEEGVHAAFNFSSLQRFRAGIDLNQADKTKPELPQKKLSRKISAPTIQASDDEDDNAENDHAFSINIGGGSPFKGVQSEADCRWWLEENSAAAKRTIEAR
jgi:hypothetical protein